VSEQPVHTQTLLGNVFDQYQNMMQIARCVREAARQGAITQPRILELSRYQTNLSEYLPEAQIVRYPTHDEKEQPSLPMPVAVPFPDKSFDVCFVTDVYEHIPTEQRPGLLVEMLRVTKGLVLLGTPVKSEMVTHADRIWFDFIWSKYAHEFEPLKQHIRFGLEPLEDIIGSLKAQGADRVVALPGNYVYRLIHQILIFFDLQYENPFSHFYESVNRIYNERIAPYDYREPCYRYLIVVVTDPALDLDLLEQTMKGPCETPASMTAAEGALIEAFRQADSRSADQLRACMAEINLLRQENESLKTNIRELGEKSWLGPVVVLYKAWRALGSQRTPS
jgi:hypothetical protein